MAGVAPRPRTPYPRALVRMRIAQWQEAAELVKQLEVSRATPYRYIASCEQAV